MQGDGFWDFIIPVSVQYREHLLPRPVLRHGSMGPRPALYGRGIKGQAQHQEVISEG